MHYTNFITFWDLLIQSALYERLLSKSKTDVNFSVIFSEFLANIIVCKNTFIQTPEISNIQKSLDKIFLTCDLSNDEIDGLKFILKESNLSDYLVIRDDDFLSNYVYNYSYNCISPPQPYPSWTFYGSAWQPPHPCLGGDFPYWDEELYQSDNTKGWVASPPITE